MQTEQEQSAVNVIYQRFDELIEEAFARLKSVRKDGYGSTFAARSERDSFASYYEDSIEQYRRAENKLVFGKLTYEDIAKDVRYIGRIGIQTSQHNPLLLDWRSSAGADFYQATPLEHRGVKMRRHLIMKDREIVGIDDELLQISDAQTANAEIIGEGALLSALSSNRSQFMVDIVSTIQKEQDTVIRTNMDGVKIIQGSPGTGKTAVALHRVAYLLYTFREQLSYDSVLVVGPSPQFIEYTGRVLPSLGETGVNQVTLAELVPDLEISRLADEREARIKGDLAMTNVIKKGINGYITDLSEDISFFIEGEKFSLTPNMVKIAKTGAKHSSKQYNLARLTFIEELFTQLVSAWEEIKSSEFNDADVKQVSDNLRESEIFRRIVNLLWMPLTPQKFIKQLLTNKKRLEAAFSGNFKAEDVKYLQTLADNSADYQFSNADIALIDEAYSILGADESATLQKTSKKSDVINYANEVLEDIARDAQGFITAQMLAERVGAEDDEISVADKRFRHIVVDEAQELSMMDFRMLRRRSTNGSFTFVGDIFQTSNPAGVHNWGHLASQFENIAEFELTINYRNPHEIAEFAYEIAQKEGLNVPKVSSPRSVPDAIELVSDQTVLELVERFAGLQIVVILPNTVNTNANDTINDTVNDTLKHELASNKNVQVLTAREVKGLEFDVVIIPDLENIGTPQDKYVALTRATQKLAIIC